MTVSRLLPAVDESHRSGRVRDDRAKPKKAIKGSAFDWPRHGDPSARPSRRSAARLVGIGWGPDRVHALAEAPVPRMETWPVSRRRVQRPGH